MHNLYPEMPILIDTIIVFTVYREIDLKKILQPIVTKKSSFLACVPSSITQQNTKKTPRIPRNSFSKVATSQVDG